MTRQEGEARSRQMGARAAEVGAWNSALPSVWPGTDPEGRGQVESSRGQGGGHLEVSQVEV